MRYMLPATLMALPKSEFEFCTSNANVKVTYISDFELTLESDDLESLKSSILELCHGDVGSAETFYYDIVDTKNLGA